MHVVIIVTYTTTFAQISNMQSRHRRCTCDISGSRSWTCAISCMPDCVLQGFAYIGPNMAVHCDSAHRRRVQVRILYELGNMRGPTYKEIANWPLNISKWKLKIAICYIAKRELEILLSGVKDMRKLSLSGDLLYGEKWKFLYVLQC